MKKSKRSAFWGNVLHNKQYWLFLSSPLHQNKMCIGDRGKIEEVLCSSISEWLNHSRVPGESFHSQISLNLALSSLHNWSKNTLSNFSHIHYFNFRQKKEILPNPPFNTDNSSHLFKRRWILLYPAAGFKVVTSFYLKHRGWQGHKHHISVFKRRWGRDKLRTLEFLCIEGRW